MKNPASILVACGAVFLLVAAGASIKSAGADTPQVVSKMGAPAAYGVTVQSDPAHPLSVSATVNVAGAADLPGNTATFNAANVCTAVLTAGLQSVGFHLDAGTLAATLTAYGTQAITAVNCASAGTCTTLTFSSGATIVVTNPNPVKDVSVVAVPGMRQIEVCTSAYSSGSATGVVTGTYLNATSSGGGGGTVTQGPAAASSAPWSAELSDGTSFYTAAKTGQLAASLDASGGAKTHEVGTAAVSGTFWQATQPVSGTFWQATQPVSGTFWQTTQPVSLATAPALVGSSATIGNVKVTDGTNTAVVKAGSTLPAASDTAIVFTLRDALPGTQNVQGLGAANAPSGGAISCVNPTGNTLPFPVKTFGTDTVAAVTPDAFAVAALLNSACTSTTACTSAQSIQWATAGLQSGELTVTAISSPTGITVACDKGYDTFNTTYTLASCYFWNGTLRKTTLANADLVASTQWAIYWTGSPSGIRVRIATFSSGSVTVAGRSVSAPGLPFPVEAKPPTQATVTLTASTAETTLLASGGTGIFLDLTYLKCSNTSSTASAISIRDATAGTVRDTLVCPAQIGPCEGQVYRVPFAQTTAANNWTIQAGTSASSIICTAQAVQR